MPAKELMEEGEEQGGDTEIENSSQGRQPTMQPPVYMSLVFRRGIERELKRLEELSATLAKRDQLHATKLAAKAKELADCEIASLGKIDGDGGDNLAISGAYGCYVVRKGKPMSFRLCGVGNPDA
ncbi:hypothetical protein AXG93_868s1120 [Marchantia polymorpha subsp. ruderalis]|uniref:Uncharacterized protein n=1 Tax=Marchantia polymorpha subsp. ruderalis TaxID=1480154 RepID=A0A176VMT9_MARPO|nr:hypothetical protein AXG93_868s1120 [Marchantia polymorpha subsp. ruderalis]